VAWIYQPLETPFRTLDDLPGAGFPSEFHRQHGGGDRLLATPVRGISRLEEAVPGRRGHRDLRFPLRSAYRAGLIVR
jgi:hypothetical protein